MKFDARAAKSLAAGDHLTMDEQPGLRLVAGSTGGRTWTYRYKSPLDGGMRQLKLGEWPRMSAAAAIVAWEARKAERDSGRCPASEHRAQRQTEKVQAAAQRAERSKGRLTVRRLTDEFAESVTRKPKGVAELKRLFATMLGPVENMLPEDVSRSVAYDLISGYSSTPVVAANLRRELGAAWDWGHDSGRLPETVPNWWRQILRGKLVSKGKIIKGKHQGQRTKRVLSVPEVGEVLRFLPHITRVNSDLITLYLWTGTRGSELVAMRGDEVSNEADGWWWTVPKEKQKTGRHEEVTDLRVPLIGRALEIVRARMDIHGGEYLFPSRQPAKLPHVDQKVVGVAVWTHMPDCELRPEWERPRWPVTKWSPHDLRRTVRTRLAALGCVRDVAEAILGHMLPDEDRTYNLHQYDRERREWLTKVIEVWEEAAAR